MVDESLRLFYTPVYIEYDLLLASNKNIRVLVVRDLLTGAYYTLAYIICPSPEACVIAHHNLVDKCFTRPYNPYNVEVFPVKVKGLNISVPLKIKELPPFLYEYKLTRSSPYTSVYV